MSENLTTRDVFQQLDTRVGRVEVDIRDSRAEMNVGFAQLRDEMNTRFDRVFGILVGLVVGIGALLVGVAGLWLKA